MGQGFQKKGLSQPGGRDLGSSLRVLIQVGFFIAHMKQPLWSTHWASTTMDFQQSEGVMVFVRCLKCIFSGKIVSVKSEDKSRDILEGNLMQWRGFQHFKKCWQ